ncbi:MAG: alpha/beta fold hydrolase [Chloroflexi bacterium]|nr:alpha/beta fold hydrolase [Chloroflexota bacterium]
MLYNALGEAKARMLTVVEEFVSVAGRRIRILLEGSGPPLVLVHGLGGSADWWLPSLPSFSRAYTTFAVDLPGSGGSDPPIDADLEAPESFLLALYDTLGIEVAHLVGHSMGGYVAALFAASHPERVDHLVLVSNAGFGQFKGRLLRIMALPLVGEMLTMTGDLGVEIFARSLFYDQSKVPRDLIAIAKKYAARRGFSTSFLRMVRTGVSPLKGWILPTLHEPLRRFQRPLLIVWGDHDCVFSVRHALDLRARLPNATIQVFDRCGHMPQIEHRDKFNELVLAFLESAPFLS